MTSLAFLLSFTFLASFSAPNSAFAQGACENTVIEIVEARRTDFIDSTNQLIRAANRDPSPARIPIPEMRPGASSRQNWFVIRQYGEYLVRKIFREQFAGEVRFERSPLRTRDIRQRVKNQLLPFLRNVIREGKTIIISLDGVDSAGKGINVKQYRRMIRDLVRENPDLAALQVKTIKLGKPAEANSSVRQFFQRWRSLFPEGPAIVFLDRSYYNRSYVEEALSFTNPRVVAEFRREIDVFERRLAREGFELHKVFLSVSLPQVVFNLFRRAMTEQRQHLLSPVDARAVIHWNDYVASIHRTFQLFKNSSALGYFVNNSYFFQRGFQTTDSRLIGGLMAMSQIIAQSSLSPSGTVPPVSPEARQIVRVLSSQRESREELPFGNEKRYSRELLEEIDLAMWNLRFLVQQAHQLGIISIDPSHRLQDKIDLGVLRDPQESPQ